MLTGLYAPDQGQDARLEAKPVKGWDFVLKDNQGPSTKGQHHCQ